MCDDCGTGVSLKRRLFFVESTLARRSSCRRRRGGGKEEDLSSLVLRSPLFLDRRRRASGSFVLTGGHIGFVLGWSGRRGGSGRQGGRQGGGKISKKFSSPPLFLFCSPSLSPSSHFQQSSPLFCLLSPPFHSGLSPPPPPSLYHILERDRRKDGKKGRLSSWFFS